MKFNTAERHARRLKWHRWFAWHPVYLPDTGQTVWLEAVWRKAVERTGWMEWWLEWEHRHALSDAEVWECGAP